MSELVQQAIRWLSTRSGMLVNASIEILLIFVMVYVFLRLLEGTRGAGILKGLAIFLGLLIVLALVGTRLYPLAAVNWVLTRLGPVVLIPMLSLFQPEIRRAFIRLGENPLFSRFFRARGGFTDELVEAVFSLARDKIGGMIALERRVGLSSYVERGVWLDAELSAELVRTIFWPCTPLHDGAIVIRQQRILAAGCLFPLTDNPTFSTELGTRHRAGIGISEESDAVAIIISEQSGRVSMAVEGAIQQDLDRRALRQALEDIAVEPLVRE